MITATLLGTGGATPYKARTTPMLIVNSGNAYALVDCGSGATLRLAEAGIDSARIDCVLFTHFHADHCVDFPVFVLTSYLAGRNEPLKVFGPEGTNKFVKMMLDDMFPYIKKLIGNITSKEFEISVKELAPKETIEIKDTEVRVGEAIHSVPTFGYRFQTDNESLSISGDTEYSEKIIELSTDSQVLIHECPFPVSMGEIPDHTTAAQVGEVASKARVATLVLTHLFEEVVGGEDEIIASIKEKFDGEIFLGEDLMKIIVNENNVKIN